MKLNKVLSANLKQFRDKYNISQEELADRAKLSTRGYGEIERGGVQTTFEILERLAIGTGLSALDLLNENLDLDARD